MKSVSTLLKETREKQNITFKKIAKETKIPINQLNNIELGYWNKFASYTYLQGAVRKIAQYLDLDPNKILTLLKREIKVEKVKFIRLTDYNGERKLISGNIIFYSFIVILLLVFVFRLISFWQKPAINITNFPKILKVNQPLIIQGEADSGALIFINDKRIFQNDNNQFKEKLYFNKGRHNLVIKAIGINGKEEVKEYEITVKEKND